MIRSMVLASLALVLGPAAGWAQSDAYEVQQTSITDQKAVFATVQEDAAFSNAQSCSCKPLLCSVIVLAFAVSLFSTSLPHSP